MKKLNKIHINTERIIKEDDLNSIRGGYDGCDWVCWVHVPPDVSFNGIGCGDSPLGAEMNCNSFYSGIFPDAHCHCI